MKTHKTFSALIIFSFLVVFNSCNKEEDDTSGELEKSYILKTNGSKSNVFSLDSILKNFAANKFERDGLTESIDIGVPGMKKVLLKDEVAKLFDPENHPCPLPAKIAKKLKRAKDSGNAWAPPYVTQFTEGLPDSVLYIPRNSVSNLLHYATLIKKNSSNPSLILVTSAPTYTNLDVEEYILSGFSSFIYSLDCSGYLNAAIEGSGVAPGADIKANAKLALEKQSSVFIGGGVIVSPLTAAFLGNRVVLDTLTRVKILRALISDHLLADDDTIELAQAYNAIWYSKTGESSFNGKGSFEANVGGSIGIASISSSSNAGGSISRKSRFSSFNTYITDDYPLGKPIKVTVADVKKLILQLASHNNPTQ